MPLQDELMLSKPPVPAHAMSLAILYTRELLTAYVDQHVFRPLDLTDPQYNVLRIVKGGPAEGYPVGEIRRRLMSRHADTPRLVDRLTSLGLLRRAAHPRDRRCSLVQLTPRGQDLLTTAQPLMDTALDRLGELLPEADQRQLVELLDRLRAGLRDHLGEG